MSERLLTRHPLQLADVDDAVAARDDLGWTADVEPLGDVLAGRAKDLDPVVLAVRYQHPTVRQHPDAVWRVELARAGAWIAPGLQQLARGRKPMHARVTVAI